MSRRYVKWLYQELPELVNKGIVSQQNADQMRQYYGEISDSGKKQFFLILCSIVGALLIGLGIISLIAHNWEQLDRSMRTVLSFAPLVIGIAIVGWTLFKENPSQGLKEGATTFLALMVGASISLISQTYNISGDLRDFTLTWMLLAVPLVYLATATLPAVIYTIGITSWAVGHIWGNTAVSFFYWPLIAIVIPHFIFVVRKEKFVVRSMLLSTFLTISIALVTVMTLIRIFPDYWMIYYPLVFSVLYLLGRQKFGDIPTAWQQPLFKLGGIGIVIISLILTYNWCWQESSHSYYWFSREGDYSVTGNVMIILWLAAAVLLNYLSMKERRLNHVLLGIAPVIAIIGFAVRPLAPVLFDIYFLVLSLHRITTGIRINRLSTVNGGLLMLAALIAVRFFDSEINLVLKGLVMIVLGAGFLATNVLIIRRREVANG